MSLLRNLGSGLRSLFRKEQVNRELDEELGEYLKMSADEKMKQGISRKEARRAVRLERGSLEVSRAYKITPMAQMSTGGPYIGRPSSIQTSGGTKSGVPRRRG